MINKSCVMVYMRNNEPQSLDSLFKAPHLLTIQERGNALSKLNKLVYQLLPNNLSEQCRVANYRQGVLVIEVASASWLTRLRYEQSKLISLLRQHSLTGLASIQYKINPELNKTQYILQDAKNSLVMRQMTPQSAATLLTLAEHCPEQLKSRLIKLANHATKIDNNK